MKQLKRVLKQREALEMTMDYVKQHKSDIIPDEELEIIIKRLEQLHGNINKDLEPLEKLQKNILKYQVTEIQIDDNEGFLFNEEDALYGNTDFIEDDFISNQENEIYTDVDDELIEDIETFVKKKKEQKDYDLAVASENGSEIDLDIGFLDDTDNKIDIDMVMAEECIETAEEFTDKLNDAADKLNEAEKEQAEPILSGADIDNDFLF